MLVVVVVLSILSAGTTLVQPLLVGEVIDRGCRRTSTSAC